MHNIAKNHKCVLLTTKFQKGTHYVGEILE